MPTTELRFFPSERESTLNLEFVPDHHPLQVRTSSRSSHAYTGYIYVDYWKRLLLLRSPRLAVVRHFILTAASCDDHPYVSSCSPCWDDLQGSADGAALKPILNLTHNICTGPIATICAPRQTHAVANALRNRNKLISPSIFNFIAATL